MDIRPKHKKKKSKAPPPISKRKLQRTNEEAELAELAEKTKDPSVYLKDEDVTMFEQLPLCSKTKQGLFQ